MEQMPTHAFARYGAGEHAEYADVAAMGHGGPVGILRAVLLVAVHSVLLVPSCRTHVTLLPCVRVCLCHGQLVIKLPLLVNAGPSSSDDLMLVRPCSRFDRS